LKPDILFLIIISVLIHTIIYILFINLIYFCLTYKSLTYDINKGFMYVLILIMMFGYIGRVVHVKHIYKAFNNDVEKASSFVNQHYNSWIFIG